MITTKRNGEKAWQKNKASNAYDLNDLETLIKTEELLIEDYRDQIDVKIERIKICQAFISMYRKATNDIFNVEIPLTCNHDGQIAMKREIELEVGYFWYKCPTCTLHHKEKLPKVEKI